MSLGLESEFVAKSADAEALPLNRARGQKEERLNLATEQIVCEGIRRFDALLEETGYASYDPYDIWGTKYGVFSRRIYYEKGKIGLPLIAPILLMEIVMPGARRMFVKKDRFATADGQLTLAYLNLYRSTKDENFLEKAKVLGEDILQYSVPGYSGKCWGYPFDWQNNRGLWRKNTPYITCTPYCFEAFLGLFDATGEQRYLDLARSIATFVYTDLKDTPTGPDATAASYSPMDETKVVNASAYRAWVLFEADARFGLPEYKAKALRNLNFILQSQQADGSWLYAVATPGEGFIDHFHTCFVLKKLFKINQRLKNEAVTDAIRKGYAYYRKHLFRADGLPRAFALEPRTQIVTLEMYNFAEAITLGALLRDMIPDAYTVAQHLATTLCERYQLPEGHFVTRVYRGGFKHTFPFLRWPQAQLFYALTNLLATSPKSGGNISLASAGLSRTKSPRRALLGLVQRKESWSLSWRGRFALAAAVLLLIGGFVAWVHPFLAVTERVDSPYLVVEGWIPNYALRESIDEFKSRPYQRIFTVGADPLTGVNVEEGDSIAFESFKRLKWMGMNPDLITAVPAHVKYRNRTFQSAVALKKWAEENHVAMTNFNVLTLGPHARRSRLLFEEAFDGHAKVGIISVENREYDAKRWWKYSEGVRELIGEWIGYGYARFIFNPAQSG